MLNTNVTRARASTNHANSLTYEPILPRGRMSCESFDLSSINDVLKEVRGELNLEDDAGLVTEVLDETKHENGQDILSRSTTQDYERVRHY